MAFLHQIAWHSSFSFSFLFLSFLAFDAAIAAISDSDAWEALLSAGFDETGWVKYDATDVWELAPSDLAGACAFELLAGRRPLAPWMMTPFAPLGGMFHETSFARPMTKLSQHSLTQRRDTSSGEKKLKKIVKKIVEKLKKTGKTEKRRKKRKKTCQKSVRKKIVEKSLKNRGKIVVRKKKSWWKSWCDCIVFWY